jgi:hypothetical protein
MSFSFSFSLDDFKILFNKLKRAHLSTTTTPVDNAQSRIY